MNSFEDFREAIKKRESGGNYKAVNQFGYMGAYQFGKPRLLDLGISIDGFGKTSYPQKYKNAKKMTKEEFLNNKELQDEIFKKHCIELAKVIKLRYGHYLNKKINNVLVTLSGLVAGAHLVGLGGVKKWLSGDKVYDGNKVSVEEYIKKFGNYNLDDLIKEN